MKEFLWVALKLLLASYVVCVLIFCALVACPWLRTLSGVETLCIGLGLIAGALVAELDNSKFTTTAQPRVIATASEVDIGPQWSICWVKLKASRVRGRFVAGDLPGCQRVGKWFLVGR